MEFRSCARGRWWFGVFHYHLWTASIKPRLLFLVRPCFLRASLSSVYFILLQLVLSSCVTAVKCRPILYHSVVIFFWSSGTIDCMFVYIWKWSSAHAQRGRWWFGVFLLPLMNSFNKTEVAVFSFRPCFLRASLSSVHNYFSHGLTYNPKCNHVEWSVLGVTPPLSIFKYSFQSQSYLLGILQAAPGNDIVSKVWIHLWQILVVRLSEMARMSHLLNSLTNNALHWHTKSSLN